MPLTPKEFELLSRVRRGEPVVCIHALGQPLVDALVRVLKEVDTRQIPSRITASCPACGVALCAEHLPQGDYIVWCGYGPCPSLVSNDGVVGACVNAAANALVEKITCEMDEQQKD